MDTQKEAAAYEIREIWAKAEMILPELLHTVAFKDNTLGMPLLCPEERLKDIDDEVIRGFMRDWYRPERMVIAGVGMDHEELVHLAQENFGDMTASTSSTSDVYTASASATISPQSAKTLYNSSSSSHPALSKSFATLHDRPLSSEPTWQDLASARAKYTGGELMINKPEEEFTHVYIAFEGLGIHDPDIVSGRSVLSVC